jgi:uncharacterized cupin superfamily protein
MFNRHQALLAKPHSAGSHLYEQGRGRVVPVCALALLLATSLVAAAVEGKLLHPFSVSATDSNVLGTPDVETTVIQGRVSKNRVIGSSVDRRFVSGLYSSQAGKGSIDSYPVDEFMYFIKGGVTMICADGTVTRVDAGEAVQVPKGWKGTWDTKGYTKFYVVYDPDKKD